MEPDQIWIRRESYDSEGPLLSPHRAATVSPIATSASNSGSSDSGSGNDALPETETQPLQSQPRKESSLVSGIRKMSDRIFGRSNRVDEACRETKDCIPVIHVERCETHDEGKENSNLAANHLFVQRTACKGRSPNHYTERHTKKCSPKPLLLGLATPSTASPAGKEPASEMGVSSLIQKQHADEHRIKAFVSFMFLCIVLLVGFAHIFFNQKAAQHSYFDNVRFLKENRSIHISNSSGIQLLRGWIGVPLPDGSVGYKCRAKDLTHNGSDVVCFEWIDQARLQVALHEYENLRCYEIHWQSLSSLFSPMDCFDMSQSTWFGGGLVSSGTKWPMNKLNISLSPFVTGAEGENRWGQVLKRQFVSSTGAAIVVDEEVPLWVGVQDQKLCISSKSGYPFNIDTPPVLNYSICTGRDTPSVVKSLADHGLWDGIRKDEMEIIRELLYDPVWRFEVNVDDPNIVESLVNFTNRIISVEWTSPGYLLLTKPWEDIVGDLQFDASRFQDIEDAFEIIHRKGFKIALETSPFFSTKSSNYLEGLSNSSERSYWISQPSRENGPLSPALIWKNGDSSMSMLDPTYQPATKWYSAKLSALKKNPGVDAILLDVGTASNLPRHFQTEEKVIDPSKLSSYYLKSIRPSSPAILGTTGAVEMPRLPTFIALPQVSSNWEGIQSLVPTILTLSVIGYPFILTPPVGGNRQPGEEIPSKELYIRWLQLNTFLPVVQFEILPFEYDSKTMEISENLAILRRNLVMPAIKKIADDSVLTGGPIIRPIWFLDSNDPNCFDVQINDEFCIGDEILVAPILSQDGSEREVYLPKGVWKDGIDGSLRKGGRWLHHHKSEIDEIPYFIRMPDAGNYPTHRFPCWLKYARGIRNRKSGMQDRKCQDRKCLFSKCAFCERTRR